MWRHSVPDHIEPLSPPDARPEIPRPPRIQSVDAYRGLVMVLMLAEVFRSCAVAASIPSSRLWAFICDQQSHAAWVGCSLHDLIQPAFYFLVGIGLIISLRRRLAAG